MLSSKLLGWLENRPFIVGMALAAMTCTTISGISAVV